MRQSRWLFQTLILSVALNVALIAIFFYFIIHDSPLHFSYSPCEEIHIESPPVASTFLNRLQAFSFEHLIELLEDERRVEQGYQVRDFALGALATYYDFDVERALKRGKLPKRKWKFEETIFLLFPGLKEKDFDTLLTFAKEQKWPYTTQGLLKHIGKTTVEKCDTDLLNYFCHTPEFILLETLFARTQIPIQKRVLLDLILETGWDKIASFKESLEQEADFSDQRRRSFLLEAISTNSKTAAHLLLITDSAYAAQHLSDEEVEHILNLSLPNSKQKMEFIAAIASSVRSDLVRQKAVEELANLSDSEDIAGKFYEKPGLKNLRPKFREQPPAAPPPSLHIIQPGESLWLIARKYGVSIETLMEFNGLQSTVIQPGKTLKIPR